MPSGSPAALGTSSGELEPAAAHVEHGVGLVGEPPPLDDVAGRLAVDGHDLVVDEDTGPVGRRSRSDGDDTRRGHGRTSLRGNSSGSPLVRVGTVRPWPTLLRSTSARSTPATSTRSPI